MIILFGQRVDLSDGNSAILRDVGTAGAFLEYDEPVPRAVKTVNGNRERVADLGLGDLAWVKAPGYTVVRDRDGAKIGMTYKGTTRREVAM